LNENLNLQDLAAQSDAMSIGEEGEALVKQLSGNFIEDEGGI
jgi:hypothetical protein